MKHQIHCAFCKMWGYGSGYGSNYIHRLLIAIRPFSRTYPKGWVCRECLRKLSGLEDHQFLDRFEKALKSKKAVTIK